MSSTPKTIPSCMTVHNVAVAVMEWITLRINSRLKGYVLRRPLDVEWLYYNFAVRSFFRKETL